MDLLAGSVRERFVSEVADALSERLRRNYGLDDRERRETWVRCGVPDAEELGLYFERDVFLYLALLAEFGPQWRSRIPWLAGLCDGALRDAEQGPGALLARGSVTTPGCESLVDAAGRFTARRLGDAVERCAPEDRMPEPGLHWIEIHFVDEDGSPYAGERYRLELGDGRVLEGVIGPTGRLRVEGLHGQRCAVAFPDLDADAWGSADEADATR